MIDKLEGASRELEVRHELERLGYNMESLIRTVAELEARLHFVMREDPTAAGLGEKTSPPERLSELGRTLQSHTEGVGRVIDRLEDLMNLLEI